MGGGAASLEDLLSNIGCWRFDIFKVANLTDCRSLRFVGWEVMRFNSSFSHFHLDPKKGCHFLERLEGLYAKETATSYHNSIHAADVTQTVHAFLVELKAGLLFDPMDALVATFS